MSLERPFETSRMPPSAGMNFDAASAAPLATPAKLERLETYAQQSRLPSLDGLRAFSILLVMLSHAGLGRIVPGGLGVTVFFFISGLLITRLLLHEIDASGEIRIGQFYVRRFLRLQPALLVYVCVASVALVLIGAQPYWKDILACLLYIGNYYVIFHGEFMHPLAVAPDGQQVSIQTPFGIVWSLAVEEHFYLFFPFVVAALARSRLRLGAVLALLCVMTLFWRAFLVNQGVDTSTIYLATDTRLDSIIYGALLAVTMSTNRGEAVVSRILGSKTAFVSGILLLLGTLAIRSPVFRDTLRYSLQGIALAPIVYGIAFGHEIKLVSSAFSHPLAVYIGKLSYSLYLYHYGAFMIASWLAITYGYPRYGAQWILVSVPLTILGAMASYHLVEKKFLGLRRRFGSVA